MKRKWLRLVKAIGSSTDGPEKRWGVSVFRYQTAGGVSLFRGGGCMTQSEVIAALPSLISHLPVEQTGRKHMGGALH